MSDEIRILGGVPLPQGGPVILDGRTKQEPVQPEIRVHEDVVTTDDKLRREVREEGEPEVRVRDSEASQQNFRKMLESDE